MLAPRTFLAAGLTFVVLGGWSLGFWFASDWRPFGWVGAVLGGMGLLLMTAGLYFRRQGWE